MPEAKKYSVAVTAHSTYLPDQSDPPQRYVWAYMVEIENAGEETVQLRARRWTITDGQGRVQLVEGEGVVGEQPVILPGDAYQYTSGCPLGTPSGSMVGSYLMETEDGDEFEAAIPAFSLDMPGARRTVN